MFFPRILKLVSLLPLVVSALLGQSQSPAIRIMPLGDSITDGTASGTPGWGGYRGTLFSLLKTVGYSLDYVFVPSAVSSPNVIFRDDFSGSSLDATKWSLGNWMLGRTRLGNAPVVAAGFARLKFDTFNPGDAGRSFRGTEILSNATFERGNGIEFEASVRVNAMPSGLVTSLFTYVSREVGSVVFSDEIDFEFLSKQIASSTTSDPVLMTTWNDWNNSTEIYTDPTTYNSQSMGVAGLRLDSFNTILIRWLPDRVEWLVNGQLIRTATTAVPDERTNIRLNFWAPASGWTDAYSNKLVPAKNARQNQTYYYDVDYVEVRRIP